MMAYMKQECVLAMDVGTTTLKTAAFDLSGEVIAMAQAEQVLHFDSAGRVIQDPDKVWRDLCTVCAEVARSAKVGRVCALAISNQRGSVVPLIGDDTPFGIVSWMDRRGQPLLGEIEARVSAEAYYERAGHPLVPYTGVSKVFWCSRQPILQGPDTTIGAPQTWLLRRMGADRTVCDLSTGSFLFPMVGDRWDSEIAGRLAVDEGLLPGLVASDEVVGVLGQRAAAELGLSAGIPLVAGGGDGQCAGVGAGAILPGDVMVNLGTGAGVQAFSPREVRDPNGILNCAHHVVRESWEVEGHTQASGAALRWLRDALSPGSRDYDSLVEEASDVEPGADGLLFVPTFNGASAPRLDPDAKAAFLGMDLAHTRGHLVRSVLEGITLEIRELVTAIETLTTTVERIKFVGGGAKSRQWSQIMADVLSRPVQTLRVADAALVGAAISASIAVNAFEDARTAVAHFVTTDRTWEPDAQSSILYESLVERYQAAMRVLEDPQLRPRSPD